MERFVLRSDGVFDNFLEILADYRNPPGDFLQNIKQDPSKWRWLQSDGKEADWEKLENERLSKNKQGEERVNEVKTKDGRALKLGWRVWKVDSDPLHPGNGVIVYACGLDNNDSVVYKIRGVNGECDVVTNDLDWFERLAKPAPKGCDSFDWKPEPEIEFGSIWKSKYTGTKAVVAPGVGANREGNIGFLFIDGTGRSACGEYAKTKEEFLNDFEPA